MLADLLVCHDLAHSPQLLQVCEGCRPAQRHGLQTPPLYHLPEFLVCSREVTVSLSQWDCGWRQIATFKVAHVIRLCSITRADSCRCNARHFLCTANQHLHFVTIRRMNEQLRPSAAQQGMSQAQCAPNVTGLTMHEVQHGTWQQAAEESPQLHEDCFHWWMIQLQSQRPAWLWNQQCQHIHKHWISKHCSRWGRDNCNI